MPAKLPDKFDLKGEILKSHSVDMRKRVQAWVGKDQQRFDLLLELFLNGGKILEQRAGWPLAFCVEQHPWLVKRSLDALLDNLKRTGLHGSVIRNTYRLLQHVEILPEHEERIFGLAMSALGGPVEVAVKACAITILKRLVERFPELRPEILLLIQEQLPGQSPAFVSRAKKEFGLAVGRSFGMACEEED